MRGKRKNEKWETRLSGAGRIILAFVLSLSLAGCGKASAGEAGAEGTGSTVGEAGADGAGGAADEAGAEGTGSAADETGTTGNEKGEGENENADGGQADPDGAAPGRSGGAVDVADMQYVELVAVEDYYGDKALYDVYAPIGSSNEDGMVFYYDHGLTFSATACDMESAIFLQQYFDESIEYIQESWQDEEAGYTDIRAEEVMKNGKDRYWMMTVTTEDFNGTPFEKKILCYLDVQDKEGVGVMWNLEMLEAGADEETALIIDELAACYHVDLEAMKASGEWLAANEELTGNRNPDKSLPETILWFNATYAPLTYSNSCDWRIVGGMEATDYNAELCRAILERDWGIEDRESALETVESLLEGGHKEKCRECMEELAEMGILEDEEETFMQELMDSGIEENLFRYVIAYYMYQDGMDADYIAAWDLCRANQLYADFYVCGYMDYEEAMDASLENSLILQKMYPSWEEMVSAYMLGYQFWQSDPCLTENSPTLRRYQSYEELLAMEDGPYTLDWEMELTKSW